MVKWLVLWSQFVSCMYTVYRSDSVSSVAWNSVTFTGASKLECIQRKFLALCQNSFFPQIHYSYMNDIEHLISIHYPVGGAT
jgi:hypothetical protein